MEGGIEEDVVWEAAGPEERGESGRNCRSRLYRTVEGQLDFAFEHSPRRLFLLQRQEVLAW